MLRAQSLRDEGLVEMEQPETVLEGAASSPKLNACYMAGWQPAAKVT
jgi:hypothetical protein